VRIRTFFKLEHPTPDTIDATEFTNVFAEDMTMQTPATAEIGRWLRIWVWFFTNVLLLVRKKMQNPAGVHSGTPDSWPPLI